MPLRQGQRVLITGGSSGIGRCLSRQLTRRGLTVVAVSNVLEDLESLTSSGEAAAGWLVDLSQPDQVAGLVARFESEIGPLDILVNNAGIGYHTTLLELEPARLRTLFEVNFFSAVSLCQQALVRMADRRRGNILNVSSASARRTLARMTAYGSSKAAMHGFTQSLRMEAAQVGVVVSEVLPISVQTPFFQAAGYRPQGRVQTPEQVAALIGRCLEHDIPELCTDSVTGWGFAVDALAPNLVARLLTWWERRQARKAGS